MVTPLSSMPLHMDILNVQNYCWKKTLTPIIRTSGFAQLLIAQRQKANSVF